MGGVCSRTRTTSDDIGSSNGGGGVGDSNNELGMVHHTYGLPSKISDSTPAVAVADGMNKALREPFSFPEVNAVVPYGLDDINDGIPRLSRTLSQKSRSTKSRQAVAKVIAPTFCLQLYNGRV